VDADLNMSLLIREFTSLDFLRIAIKLPQPTPPTVKARQKDQ
jgi:hypothetical protein